MNKAVFLDRDGTLNIDTGYPANLGEIRLIDGAVAAVRKLNLAGYLTIVISNQSGVARGFFNEADVQNIHHGMMNMFAADGARLSEFYYCPHHPDGSEEKYRKSCECRKPGSLLIEKAIRDHHIDPSKSWMIGDKFSDVMAGKNAGLSTVLVRTGAGEAQYREFSGRSGVVQPDAVVHDLAAAAALITSAP